MTFTEVMITLLARTMLALSFLAKKSKEFGSQIRVILLNLFLRLI